MKLSDKIFTVSNLLSLLRLFSAIPFWILLDDFNDPSVRKLLVILAISMAATDLLDGYFARKFNQVTELGKILDPVADKVVLGVIFLKFYALGIIPLFFFLLVIVRDALILLAGITIKMKFNVVLQSNLLGKITVVFIALVVLLKLLQTDESLIYYIIIYYVSMVLIVLSVIIYSVRAINKIRSIRKN
ncbi:MAG: CDP-alcohol phosphatidyltransferase family protein [Ignavibacteriaceae bacterium]